MIALATVVISRARKWKILCASFYRCGQQVVNERRCIITNEPITPENNSRAHVIPSALGGTLKPWDILCKNGNGLLGETVDLPLIQAFQSVMTLLNGSRDRGENQPVRMTDASGRTYVMKFGEPLELVQRFLGSNHIRRRRRGCMTRCG